MSRALVAALAILLLSLVATEPARAVPSFAEQTGLPCSECHVGAFGPQLKPFGRQFKLNGYTLGDGNHILPPVSAMAQTSFTHTTAPQAGGAAPSFGPNDNLAADQTSIFVAGQIYDHLGAFIQLTYDGVGHDFHWDNTDIRYANSTTLAGHGLVYGVTLNNNPTVQDLWNTIPAWGFPFAASPLAPTPGAATLLDGGLAQTVAGAGLYADWDNLLYAELTTYHDIGLDGREAFGIVPAAGQSMIDGFAPYWRVALHQEEDGHSFEIGTYGLSADIFPAAIRSSGTDHFTDVALDAQYQYTPSEDWNLSAYLTWIHEDQRLSASQVLSGTNGTDSLDTVRSNASLTYQDTYTVNAQYFQTTGSNDAVAFATPSGSPNNAGWIGEIDYTPSGKAGPSFLPPWLNVKLSAQYVAYTRFDGTSSGASANDTLYLLAWWAVPLF